MDAKKLEEAKEIWCEEHNDDCFDATGDRCPHIREAFIAGAKWQESSKGLNIDYSNRCFHNGVEKGRAEMKREIYAEIERRIETYKKGYANGDDRRADALELLLSFIDSLPEQPVEETPEPYTGVYDEAYLQEKIAKATKSWEGVDIDKMLAECRGYEQPVEGLEEVAEKYRRDSCNKAMLPNIDGPAPEYVGSVKDAFIAGAKWMKAKMLENAVEVGNVVEEGRYCPEIGPIFLDESAGLKPGDKVRVIVIKED